jgi:stage II sporulation protein GA (sporulation sigma-E factor processing peptidase)
MVIYLDLIILANLLLDYSLLVYTGVITNTPIKKKRMMAATIFAVSSLILFFIENMILFSVIRFIWSLLIIKIAYKSKTMKDYCLKLIIFYLLNYTLAGILISFNFDYLNRVIFLDLMSLKSWLLLGLAFIIANVLTYTYKVSMDQNHYEMKHCLDYKIILGEQEYTGCGLIDTGNVVTSQQLPVIFVSQTLFNETIDESYCQTHQISYTYVYLKTIIDKHMALAFKPDGFYLNVDGVYHKKAVYLSVVTSFIEQDHYNALLHANILTKGG